MEEAVLYFHQGWTDIINCLGLVNYVSSKYKTVYVCIREDAKDLFLYSFRNPTKQVVPILVPKELYTEIHPYDTIETAGLVIEQIALHFHGIFDIYGTEPYFDAYNRALDNKMCFVEAFYTPYDIPYSVRTDWFEVTRDAEREALVYEVFTQKYGEEYGLNHLVEVNSSFYPIIELDKISDYFFDMALVLDRAKEIHVIDSVWAAVIYHLQAKYGICSSIPVYISCKRGYDTMFSSPVKHPNWIWVQDVVV